LDGANSGSFQTSINNQSIDTEYIYQLISKTFNYIDQSIKSINQSYICSNEIHGQTMPAIHQKALVWLLLTFSTSPSKTTIQIAIDSNPEHLHILLDGSLLYALVQ
jgi:hypothetical protein